MKTFDGGGFMENSNCSTKVIYIRWFLIRFSLVVYDILVVNFAYFLALLVRFYVNFEFNVWAVKYIPAFMEFSPFYTVCCLIVFYVFGLYKSLWKYAGMSDMNRIVISGLITCVIHIVGTLVFVMRMPISYYILGAAFQFVLISISRFSYRLILIEKSKFSKKMKSGTVNVMVVGTGESGRTVIKHLERDENNVVHPVCMIDFNNDGVAGTMAGVPVVGGIGRIKYAVKKYKVERVILADTYMPAEIRRNVREICREINVDVQNFSGYFQTLSGRIPLRFLLEYVDGPVEIVIDENGSSHKRMKPEDVDMSEKYIVSSIAAENETVCIKLIRDVLHPNDTNAEWVRSYQQETGGDISFF